MKGDVPTQLSINHLFELVTGAEYQHYTLILSFLIPAWILEQRTDIHKIVRTLEAPEHKQLKRRSVGPINIQ